MNNFFKRQVARESLAEDLVPDSVNLESPEDNLDAQLSELPSVEAELDNIDTTADVLETDMERVEGHVELAEDAIEAGEELDEGTVGEIEVAQESIRRRYNINTTRVARESFRDGSRGNTKVAHESWKDTLKAMWQRFLDLLKAARRKIIEFKLKYINAGKSAQKRAKKYREMMKKIGTEKAKEEITGSFVGQLAIGRKFDLENSVAIARGLGGKMKSAAGKFQSDISAVEASLKVDGEGKLTNIDGSEVDLGGVTSKLSTLPGLEAADSTYAIKAYPGDNYVQQGKMGKQGAEYLVINVVNGGDKPEDVNIPTPSHTQISTAISGLNAVGTEFEKLLKDFDSYDRQVEKLEKEVEKLVEKFDKATEDDKREELEASRVQAKAEVDKYKACNKLARVVNTTVIKGLDGYIKAGMGAYKKAKK